METPRQQQQNDNRTPLLDDHSVPISRVVIPNRPPPPPPNKLFARFEESFPTFYLYLYAVLAVGMMSSYAYLAKSLSTFPTMELLTIRSFVCVGLLTAYINKVDQTINIHDKKVGKTLLLMSFIGFFSQFFYLKGIVRVSMGEGLTIFLISPLIQPLLAKIVAGDPLQGNQGSALLMAIVGIVLIWRPGFIFGRHKNEHLVDEYGNPLTEEEAETRSFFGNFGALICLMQAVCSAMIAIVKKTGAQTLPQTTVLSQSLIMATILSFVSHWFLEYQFPTWENIEIIILMGFLYFIAHLLFTRIVTDSPKRQLHLQIIFLSQAVIAVLLDFFVLNDVPALHSLIGMGLILVAFFVFFKGGR